jgi:hypothetical protein
MVLWLWRPNKKGHHLYRMMALVSDAFGYCHHPAELDPLTTTPITGAGKTAVRRLAINMPGTLKRAGG